MSAFIWDSVCYPRYLTDQGGFQLVDLIITELKNHLICWKCSYWWKIYLKKNSLQYLLSSLNAVVSTNERTEFITSHVIFKLHYNQIYQLKTTLVGYIPGGTNTISYESWHLQLKFDAQLRATRLKLLPQKVTEVARIQSKKILIKKYKICSFWALLHKWE